MIQGLTVSIEALVNRALCYDPSSQQAIAAIDQVLAVNIHSGLPLIEPGLTLYFRGQEDGLAVLSYHEGAPVTQLSGSAISLINLLKQPSNLANSGVTLAGDSALLQRWQHILQQLDIDWEDMISEILGDIAGPLAANKMRDSAHWVSNQVNEQQRLSSEYMIEEARLTPSQQEAEAFFQSITYFKNDIDRLEARIQQLAQQQLQQADNSQDSQTSAEEKPQ